MKKYSKSMLIMGVATVSSVALVAGVSSAQDQTSRQSDLIDKVSQSHNIDREELESTFNEFREEKKAERGAKRQEFLQSKVDDGTITSEQKDMLESRESEMKEAINMLKESDANREEIKSKIKELKVEFKTWAEEQGIDLEELRPEDAPNKGRRHLKNRL